MDMEKQRRIPYKIKKGMRPLRDYSSLPNGCEQAETRLLVQDPLIDHGLQSDPDDHEDGSRTIQAMAQNLPKPSDVLPENLQQYLLTLQEALSKDLSRLGPDLKGQGSLGAPLECYHSQIFHHLHELLQKTNDTRGLFILMQWVLQSYLSLETLGQLHLHGVDATKQVDLLLLTEWVTNARSKLLQSVHKEFRDYTEKILEMDRTHPDVNDEEACIRVYLDIIQLAEGTPRSAETLSSSLAAELQDLSFAELLSFLQRYFDEQTETLKKKTKMEESEMVYFLKTLKTCTEIKQYVTTNLTRTNEATRHLLTKIIEVLKNMEAFTFTCVKKITSNTAEGFLKTYFTTQNKQFFDLISKVQTCFPKKKWCEDVTKKVLVEVYKIIAHVYVKQLVKVRPEKLAKRWSPDVCQTIRSDAEILHRAISEMVPGVQHWNQILLKPAELRECDSPDMVLLITAVMRRECPILREDQDLQWALLRWKGLPSWKIRQMLEDIDEHQTSRSAF